MMRIIGLEVGNYEFILIKISGILEKQGASKRNKTIDLFQPKTLTFSTRALIWVHFKTVYEFSQPIFSLFSNLKMHYTI